MFSIRDLRPPAVCGPAEEALAGGLGAGGGGDGERGKQPGELHAAPQPPPGRGGAEGGGEPFLHLPLPAVHQPEPPELPAPAPGWRRTAVWPVVSDGLLLPPAALHQHPDQRQPAAG